MIKLCDVVTTLSRLHHFLRNAVELFKIMINFFSGYKRYGKRTSDCNVTCSAGSGTFR